MKLRIISDGTLAGTKVVDALTGAVLDDVARVRFDFDARDYPFSAQVELTLLNIEVDVVGELVKRG